MPPLSTTRKKTDDATLYKCTRCGVFIESEGADVTCNRCYRRTVEPVVTH